MVHCKVRDLSHIGWYAIGVGFIDKWAFSPNRLVLSFG